MQYRKEIDGLRAIAVLPVILFHAGFESFSGGFVGVDIFFVISGYLITSILLNNLSKDKFSIVDFYERRARRILPALFFVMLVSLPFAWRFLFPADMQSFSQSLIAVSLFFSNLLFWYQSGYFDTSSDLKPLLHTWSLSVEEQFYIIFPILLFFAWKYCKKQINYILLFLVLASFAFSVWSTENSPSTAFFMLPSRAWELLVGSMVALYLSQAETVKTAGAKKDLFGWLGLVLILVAIFCFDKKTAFPGLNALLPVLGTALIIVFANSENSIGKTIGNKSFVFIGLLSYSAYLWHQPVFAFARHGLREEPSHLYFLVLIFLVFALAFLTWKFVEKPFRLPSSISRVKVFSFSILFILFFVCLGSLGHSYKGFEQRFERVLQGDVGYKEYIAEMAKTGMTCKGVDFSCRQTAEGEADIVVIGDSHAEHLFIGMNESFKDKNIALYYTNGMPFLDDANFEKIFKKLGDGKKQKVLITFYYYGRMEGRHDGFYERLSETIKMLQENNKEVIFLSDVPKFKYEAEQCIYERFDPNKISTCDLSKEDIYKQHHAYDEIIKRISKELNIQVIDGKEAFFNGEFYRFIKDDVILYRDKHHLNIPGSHFVANYIKENLK